MGKVNNTFTLISVILVWTIWQLLLAFGIAIPGETIVKPEAIQLLFAGMVVAVSGHHSEEVANVSSIGDFFRKIAIALVFLSVIFAPEGSPTGDSWFVAAVGLIGILILVRTTLGSPIAIAGILIFGGGLGYCVFSGGCSIGFRNIIDTTWSDKGVFGDGLLVSAYYVFIFLGLGVVLKNADLFQGMARFVSRLFNGKAVTENQDTPLTVLARGIVSGATSAAFSSRAGHVSESFLTDEDSKLTQAEQGGILSVAATFGQFTPPILSASGFLISQTLEISYLQVLIAMLIPAFLAVSTVIYFSRAAYWRNEVVDTSSEIIRFVRGIILALLASIGFSAAAFYVVSFSPDIQLTLVEAVVIAVAMMVTQLSLLVFAKRRGSSPLFMSRVGRSYWPVFGLFVLLLVVFDDKPEISAAISFIYGLVLSGFIKTWVSQGNEYHAPNWKAGFASMADSLYETGKLTAIVSLALAFVGIVVAPLSIMGLGPMMTELFSTLSANNFIIALILTAVLTLIAGLAFSTTASYLLVATLMVPIVSAIGSESGIFPTLLSLHVFILFFAVISDLTPPDDIAIEGIARSWKLDKRTLRRSALKVAIPSMVLPFALVGKNTLFLSEETSLIELLFAVTSVTVGLILLVHVAQGHFIRKLDVFRSLLMIILSLVLIFPSTVIKNLAETRVTIDKNITKEITDNYPQNQHVVLKFSDPFGVDQPSKLLDVQVFQGASITDAIEVSGIKTMNVDGNIYVSKAGFGLSLSNIRPGMKLESIQKDVKRFDYRLLYLFALFLLIAVIILSVKSRKLSEQAHG